MTYSTDDLYGDLHSARERLCRAQTHVLKADHRNRLGVALIQIDLVGSEACPEQWSQYDMPAHSFCSSPLWHRQAHWP